MKHLLKTENRDKITYQKSEPKLHAATTSLEHNAQLRLGFIYTKFGGEES